MRSRMLIVPALVGAMLMALGGNAGAKSVSPTEAKVDQAEAAVTSSLGSQFVAPVAANEGDDPVAWSFSETTKEATSTKQVTFDKRLSKTLNLRLEMPTGFYPASKVGCKSGNGGVNSYIQVGTGKRVWVPWTNKPATICPDKSSGTGWRKVGPVNCGNEFVPWFMPKPARIKIYTGQYRVYRDYVLKYKVTVKGNVAATGASFAACQAGDAWAVAYAVASAYGSASITFEVEARSTLEATASGFQRASLDANFNQQIKGSAQVQVRASIRTVAAVSCKGGKPPLVPPLVPPPGCNNCPPPPPPPSVCPAGFVGTPPVCLQPKGDGSPGTPPGNPGQNPPNDPGSPSGTTPGGGTPGGGLTPCPPGWEPDHPGDGFPNCHLKP